MLDTRPGSMFPLCSYSRRVGGHGVRTLSYVLRDRCVLRVDLQSRCLCAAHGCRVLDGLRCPSFRQRRDRRIRSGMCNRRYRVGVGQSIWSSRQPKILRYAVAAVFIVPAVWTGYCATQQISTLIVPSATWQSALAIVGAVAVGLTAFVRLTSGVAVLDWAMTKDSHV